MRLFRKDMMVLAFISLIASSLPALAGRYLYQVMPIFHLMFYVFGSCAFLVYIISSQK